MTAAVPAGGVCETGSPASEEPPPAVPRDRLRFRASDTGMDAILLRRIDEEPVVIGRLALAGPKGNAVRSGDFVYLVLRSAGIVIVDISDAYCPFEVGRIVESRAVRVELAGGQLRVWLTDGGGLVYGLTDPRRPQPAAAVGPAPVPPAPPEEPALEAAPKAAPKAAPIRRGYIGLLAGLSAQPSFHIVGGLESNSAEGLWIGSEFTQTFSTLSGPIPIPDLKFWLGYSSKYVGFGAILRAQMAGFLSPFFSGGPVFRFGRIDGTHVRLTLDFPLYPVPYYVPYTDLSVHARVHQRLWLLFRGRGGVLPASGIGEAGVEILVGPGKWQSILVASAGGGLVWWGDEGYGAAVNLAYESRW